MIRGRVAAATALVTLGLAAGWWVATSRLVSPGWDFTTNLWGPAHLLLDGRSPYDIESLFRASGALWMPTIIGAFFPLGWLPLQVASNVWLLVSVAVLWGITLLTSREASRPLVASTLALLGLLLFPTTIAHLQLGQVSLLVCFLLCVVAANHRQLHPAVLGLLLALSLAKPQLLLLFLPALVAVFLRERPHGLLPVGGFAVMWAALLCIPLFVGYPGWTMDWLRQLAINPDWFYPSAYAYVSAASRSSIFPLFVAGLVLSIGIIVTVRLVHRGEPLHALLWSLALTPLVSPVGWSWDFVLMYPLLVSAAARLRTTLGAAVLIGGYFFCSVGFSLMKWRGLLADQLAWWVPPFLIGVLLLSQRIEDRAGDLLPGRRPLAGSHRS